MIEPESFEEDVVTEPEYVPEHPVLASYRAAALAAETKHDHLDDYVEVDPFASKLKPSDEELKAAEEE